MVVPLTLLSLQRLALYLVSRRRLKTLQGVLRVTFWGSYLAMAQRLQLGQWIQAHSVSE